MTKLPKLFIFTGADQVTGALMSNFAAARLLRNDAELTLILSSNHLLTEDQLPEDCTVRSLPLARPARGLLGMLAYPAAMLRSGWALRQALRAADCDRLQINDFHFAEGAIVRLLGFRGRIVTWIRIDPRRYGIVGRLWLAMARWSSDDLVVVSRFIAGCLPSGYRSTLIYDAAPPTPPAPRPQGQRLLFIGNYIEGKGQDDAIRAFHLIADGFPGAELVFHGSDMGIAKNKVYRAGLERLAEAGAGRQRIFLLPFVPNPGDAYREALAAVNCSHSESFSLTCLEASAHGLAVVATRCGGPEEIIEDGVTGFLVPVGDVAAIASRMSDLLDQPEEAAAMGEAGKRLVNERFSPEQFRRQTINIFELR